MRLRDHQRFVRQACAFHAGAAAAFAQFDAVAYVDAFAHIDAFAHFDAVANFLAVTDLRAVLARVTFRYGIAFAARIALVADRFGG